ncbi:AAA family ATPase [Celerinatantimonas yamalensis]|uniref:Chromosome partitioning protein ParA n=1 Tax=Celerinatantimonas yamalensis TaxID=559956 RepID=A0ABW9G234_9GAMM
MAILELSELLKKESVPAAAKKTIASTVLFYQSSECAELIAEAYRFEGYELPEMLDNKDPVISDYVDEHNPEIVLLELNKSREVAKDAERISHMLPNHSSVIVIGQEDAISTIRNLKALGFYYLFWPVTKHELIDFVVGVSDNRLRQRGPGQNRKAKYIGIYGSKGGVGASLIASEIAYTLSDLKSSTCILVDHNYEGGNMDVMLARDDLHKSNLQTGSIAASLDSSAAKALMSDVTDRLSYLALNGEQRSHEEMRDLTDNMVELVAKDSNFVVEDLSASVDFSRHLDWMTQRYDSLLVVIEPSVSSIREASRTLSAIRKKRVELDHPLRLLIVLNQRLPEKYNSVTYQEIEKYLGMKVDIVIPFIPEVNQMKLYQKHLYNSKTKALKPLRHLVKLIMGEQTQSVSPLARLTKMLRLKG